MKNCIIGVDFGKTSVRFAVSGGDAKLEFYTKQAYIRGNQEQMNKQVFEGIDNALKQTGYDKEDILGIGVGVPAVVDRETGIIVWGPDWDFLAGISITKSIADRYGVRVLAEVDTVMAAWGEVWAGVGRNCDRFGLLTWGTGLGAAIVTNGEVAEYPDNLFAEFGHSIVSDDDWPCKCGARGCVNSLVCGGGIAKHGQIAVKEGKKTILKEFCSNNPDEITSSMVFEAADKGDEVAMAILHRVAVLLGRLCSNVVLTFQPEKIVIVGGIAARSNSVLKTINKTMKENCWLIFKGITKCEVVASELGDTAGVLGAIYKIKRTVERQNNNANRKTD